MSNSHPISPGEHFSDPNVVKNEPYKGKTIGFAIVIILGLGGLVVAGTGLGGCFQAGSLSHIGQVNSLIMMAAGSGGGILFLIVGIVGSVKNCQKGNTDDAHTHATSTQQKDINDPKETPPGEIYGLEKWKIWEKVEIVGTEPPIPEINWNAKPSFLEGKTLKETCMLLFIPEVIKVNGKERRPTLNLLEEISGQEYAYYSKDVKNELGDTPIESGWVLMTKDIVSDKSRNMTYEAQKALVEIGDYRLPNSGELVIGILLHHAHTKKKLYSSTEPQTYSRTGQLVQGKYPVMIGGSFISDSGSLDVTRGIHAVESVGVGMALSKF